MYSPHKENQNNLFEVKNKISETTNKRKIRKILQIGFYMFLGYVLGLSTHQASLVEQGARTFIQKEINSMVLPKESVFRPIYVYANHELADQEVPERPTNPDELPQQTVDSPYGQVFQDKIILALVKANDKKSNESVTTNRKYFVDLAANDAIILSNTLYLEQNGWDGLCIEGNPEYWYGHGRYRRCSIVGAFVGGKPGVDGTQVDIALRGAFGGIAAEDMDNANEKKTNVVKRELVSIHTVFQEMNVPTIIDYFSLDVEGAESLVMANFPWDDYKFRFMTVERPKDDLKAAFEAHGYNMVKMLVDWGETLWAHNDSVKLSQDEMLEIITQAQK